jgi:hypothetical protein
MISWTAHSRLDQGCSVELRMLSWIADVELDCGCSLGRRMLSWIEDVFMLRKKGGHVMIENNCMSFVSLCLRLGQTGVRSFV